MPLWLVILLGAGIIYLIKQGQSQATSSAAQLPTGASGSGTTGGTDMPTDVASGDDFGPPPPVVALISGTSYTVPTGTQLFSDSKLTQSAGSVISGGTSAGLNVTVTGNSIAANGSISVSYVDQGSGKTMWFAQPGS
jgi:hypothetical protein